MRIAVAQIVSGEDPQKNLELIEQFTGEASDTGAHLLVFPEATHRAFGHPLRPIAEDISGPWADAVRTIAKRHGVIIVVGMFTPGDPSRTGKPRVRNTLLAVGPSVFVTYDKLHLYDANGFEESRTVEPGEREVQFPALGLNFGLATCYDIRFPQLFQAYARAGAHATLLPTSWGAGPGKVEQWRTLAVARALDSTQYVIAAAQGVPSAAGVQAPDGAPTGVGHSMIVAPTGEIVAEAGQAPELLVAEIDSDTVVQAQEKLPVLANARHDVGF